MLERITIHSLDSFGVTIQRQKYIQSDGIEYPVGQKHSISYANSNVGRVDLQQHEPDAIVAAVMSIWGTVPTVTPIEK
jgi:hypothetical protein